MPITTLDIAKIEAGADYPIIEEAIKGCIELELIPAATIDGTTIPLTVRTGLPKVGFRNMNQGVDPVKSTYDEKVFQTFNLDAPIQIDEKLVSGAKNPARVLNAESKGVIAGAKAAVGHQFYYGDASGNGFPGLIAQSANDNAHVINVGATADRSSIWLVEIGEEKLEFLWGNGQVIRLDDWKKADLKDAKGKEYPGYKAWMKSSVGLRLANKDSAYRAKNIGIVEGKTANDETLYSLLRLAEDAKVDLSRCIFLMSGRTREQIRKSRTATNPTGAPAPMPKEIEGIPIYVSTHISNNEAA